MCIRDSTQMHAYLHLHGVTNTDPKWMLFYLQDFVERDPRLCGAFFKLYYLEGTGTPAGRRQYVFRSINFVDELFRRSRALLRARPDIPSGESGLARLKARLRMSQALSLIHISE